MLRRVLGVGCSGVALLLAGCGAHPTVGSAAMESVTVTGRIHGGQQPISYSTVQLYTVGTGGDGSTASPLLTQTVTSDVNGNFSITGLYSCTSATQVYITATGGYPSNGVVNNNLQMMTALGSCTQLQQTAFIYINELTTVAAVNALYPYMTSATAVGSGTGDVAALNAAFTLASEFVNPTTGTSPGVNVPSGYTVPTAEINTLGDAMAACVNSGGGVANDGTTSCGSFFGYTTPINGTAPTNTLIALLDLAENPTLNTASIWDMALPTSPFQPTLGNQPVNFTVALTATAVLQISPSGVTFPSTAVGATATALPVTITNTGTATAILSSIAITGSLASVFGETNNCMATLVANESCTVEVTAAPSALGLQTASLVVTSNGTGSPQSVGLSVTGNTGTVGALTPSATTLSWFVAHTFQDVTLTNTGTLPISFTASTGTTYFTYTGNTCSGVVPAQSTCVLTVESLGFYTATGSGGAPYVYNDTLTITDSASNGPQTVALTSANSDEAYGTSGTMSFGPVALGSYTTAVLDVSAIYYNDGESTYLTLGGANSGDFSASDTAATQGGYGLLGLAGSSYECTIYENGCAGNITFAPFGLGTRTARLYFGAKQYVILTGTGVAAVTLTLNPSTLTFATTPLGGATASQSATLANTGTAAETIPSFSISGTNPGDFAETNNCPSSLAAGAVCTIQVTFSPTVAAARTATLVASAVGETLSVGLSGTGTAASTGPVTLSTSSLTFHERGVPQLVTLSNYGTLPLGISGFQFSSANYTETDNCGSSLSGQSQCNIYVTPGSTVGNFTGTMTVVDSDTTDAQTVSLTTYGAYTKTYFFGEGTPDCTSGYLCNSAINVLDFSGDAFEYVSGNSSLYGEQLVMTQSAEWFIQGENVLNGCGEPIVNYSCSLNVFFNPAAVGFRYNTATDNSGNNFLFKGVGFGTTTSFLFYPDAVSFSSVPEGSSANLSTQVVGTYGLTPANNSTYTTLTYQSGTITGADAADFSITSCNAEYQNWSPLSTLQSCSFGVTFMPKGLGPRSATVTATYAGSSGSTYTQSFLVTGNGGYPAPTVPAIAFGNVQQGSQGTQVVTVTMPSKDFASATISGTGFALSGATTCAQSATSCSFTVVFTPNSISSFTGSLTVTDTVTGATATSAITGAGNAAGAPAVSLNPTSLTFSPRSIGTESLAQTVTLTNTGTTSLVVSSVTIGGTNAGDYAQTNGCVTTIAANGTCTISVTNTPTFVGVSSATITIVSNAASSPNMIGLSGTGQ